MIGEAVLVGVGGAEPVGVAGREQGAAAGPGACLVEQQRRGQGHSGGPAGRGPGVVLGGVVPAEPRVVSPDGAGDDLRRAAAGQDQPEVGSERAACGAQSGALGLPVAGGGHAAASRCWASRLVSSSSSSGTNSTSAARSLTARAHTSASSRSVPRHRAQVDQRRAALPQRRVHDARIGHEQHLGHPGECRRRALAAHRDPVGWATCSAPRSRSSASASAIVALRFISRPPPVAAVVGAGSNDAVSRNGRQRVPWGTPLRERYEDSRRGAMRTFRPRYPEYATGSPKRPRQSAAHQGQGTVAQHRRSRSANPAAVAQQADPHPTRAGVSGWRCRRSWSSYPRRSLSVEKPHTVTVSDH